MNDFAISLIRTWVPKAVGFVLGLAAVWIGDFDSTELTLGVVAFVEAAYYGLVRWAETKWPVFGKFLGRQIQPTYE